MAREERRIEALGLALRAYLAATARDRLTDARRLPAEALAAEQALIDAVTALEELVAHSGGLPLIAAQEFAGSVTMPRALRRTDSVRERDGERTSWVEFWNRPPEDWRIWDEAGRTYHCVSTRLPRSRVERLYFDPNVAVGVCEAASTELRWIDRSDRGRAWREEVEARTYDPKWRDRGSRQFVALEFCRLEVPILVFNDFD
jgi:hypothetical protein